MAIFSGLTALKYWLILQPRWKPERDFVLILYSWVIVQQTKRIKLNL